MTNSNRYVRNAVRLALMTAATSATPLALAQTAPAQPAAPVEEVVVTGSRLLQAPNEISISPITSVTSQDIQARRLDVLRGHTGDRADGDLIRRLQQARTRDDNLLHGGRRLRGGCLGQRQRSR